MSDKEYHADFSRLSNSMLSVLKRSPEEFEQRYITRTWIEEETPAMRFGSLLHCVCLEPQEFEKCFVVPPKMDRRTKEGKAMAAEFGTLHAGKTFIEKADLDTALTCFKRLCQHDEAGPLLQHAASYDAIIERPITFTIEGTHCRAKPDWLSVPLKLILDVKTTDDASPEGFAKSVATFGYYRQAAMYSHGCYEVFGFHPRFVFACVEKKPPYSVACYELELSVLQAGRSEIVTLIYDYERRKAVNNWKPSWSSGVVPLSLPRWYRGQVLTMDEE
jgi:hypothetical protein